MANFEIAMNKLESEVMRADLWNILKRLEKVSEELKADIQKTIDRIILIGVDSRDILPTEISDGVKEVTEDLSHMRDFFESKFSMITRNLDSGLDRKSGKC
jgi:hypothetical protein